MDYLISFLEGIITFISPCLLPLLPVYVSYFAGQGQDPAWTEATPATAEAMSVGLEGQGIGTVPASAPAASRSPAVVNALGFVLGFSLVFMALGAFAGTLGSLLRTYSLAVNLVSGLVVILFGLNYLDVIRIPFLNTNRQLSLKRAPTGFLASMLFGIVFSIGWTPCVGAFLGSALALAAAGGDRLRGMLMLLSFSAGLGIPFIASAVLIDRLKSTFAFIRRHYRLVNQVAGALLILVGILIATGLMNQFMSLLTPP